MLKSAASCVLLNVALLELNPRLLQANHSTNSHHAYVKKLMSRKSGLIAIIPPPGAEVEGIASGTTRSKGDHEFNRP